MDLLPREAPVTMMVLAAIFDALDLVSEYSSSSDAAVTGRIGTGEAVSDDFLFEASI